MPRARASRLPITVCYSAPPHIVREVRPIIDAWLHLLPPWFAALDVTFVEPDTETESDLAEITVREEYRLAHLTIYPRWLAQDDDARATAIRHEFAHVLVAPIARFAERLVERVTSEGGRSREWLMEDLRRAEESVVTDLATVLRRAA